MASLLAAAASWASVYANHAALRTLITFAHVGSLLVGGGAAITVDRSMLRGGPTAHPTRLTALDSLGATHRIVVGALLVMAVSGALMFAADVDAMLYSRVFWIKMGLVALLTVNGALLWAAETRARRHDQSAWLRLRLTAFASAALWLLATLAGVALLNIG